MKTQPAKLLMALLFSVISTAAIADDSKESKDAKDSNVTASATRCTSQVDTSCGIKVVVTNCTGSTPSTSTKSGEQDDSSHKSKDKDAKDNKNDRDRNDDLHKDHANHSNDSVGNKISICHRVGAARTNLTVANDGYASGHTSHDLDTIGRCEDFDTDKSSDDSKADNDKDHKISLSDKGYSVGLTTTQVACLAALPGMVSIQSSTRGGARTLH
jgi:hypothetical protein